jgi:hypothetical protein
MVIKDLMKKCVPSAELDQLQDYIEQLECDARRYKWLRDSSCPPHQFYISVPEEYSGVKFKAEEVDAYIDLAMGESTRVAPGGILTEGRIHALVGKAMNYYGFDPKHAGLTSGAGFVGLAHAVEREVLKELGSFKFWGTYMDHRHTPEGTYEFWGTSEKRLPRGTKLYIRGG